MTPINKGWCIKFPRVLQGESLAFGSRTRDQGAHGSRLTNDVRAHVVGHKLHRVDDAQAGGD